MDASKKSLSNKLQFILILFIFILALFLFLQNHKLNKNIEALQNQVSNLNNLSNTQNTRITALETNSSQFQSAQRTLKSLQITNASLLLTQLQHDLLQGENKAILLNDLNSLNAISTNLQSSQINASVQNLKTAINNLPNIDPNSSINQLNLLQQSLATLSFTTPSMAQANMDINVSNWFNKIWQHFKNLIVVRTDNDIGAQLVSSAARFDAVRQLNLLIQEATWQILTAQDPSATLLQLKITTSAYTENNAAQTTWLAQLNTLQTNPNYYTNAQIQPVLSMISTLQSQFSQQ